MKRKKFFQYAGLGSVGLVVAANEQALAVVSDIADGQPSQLGVPQ